MNLKHSALGFFRDVLGVDIYRRNSHPWGEAQLWYDVRRLVKAAATNVQGGPVAFDVGAFLGDTIDRITPLIDWRMIHGFEPYPQSYTKLEAKFSRRSNVKLHKFALSDQSGPASFTLTKSSQSNSLLRPNLEPAIAISQHAPAGIIEILTNTIDAVSVAECVERITLLKIDVQGAQYEVLKGATRMLSENRIDVIVCETEFVDLYVGQKLFSEVLALAGSFELSLFGIYAPRPDRFGRIAWADSVFFRTALLEQLS